MARRRPRKSTLRFAARAGELALAAPVVIAARTARMAAAGTTPNARDRTEMRRMSTEKAAAFGEAAVAMALRWHRLQVEWMLGAWRAWFDVGRFPERAMQAWHDVAHAGLAPLHRTATRNARRLTRRKR